MDDFFAPPPFDAAQAQTSLRRSLRALGLQERGVSFVWQAKPMVELEPGTAALSVRLAQAPHLQPRWDRHLLQSHADVRHFLDELKKRLARWSDE